MIELDVDKGSIEFKESLDLGDFGKAMGHFNKMFKLLFKRDAMYTDFTDFLATCEGVRVIPGIKDSPIKPAKPSKVTGNKI
jgi:hypothetical protein